MTTTGTPRRRRLGGLALVCVLPWLGACAPHFEKPDVYVQGVSVKSMKVAEQELTVRLKVVNPNGISLPLEGAAYAVTVNGEPFAKGESTTAVVVPARGSADVELPLVLDLRSGLGGVLTLGTLLSGGLDYRVTGNVRTGITFFRNVPFDAKGKIGVP